MYRVIAIVLGGLTLAACSSSSDWLNLDALKPAPVMETVQFESTPPGAEVKLSSGQTCRTPCALAIPHPESGGYDATFTLTGFQPATEQIQLTSLGDNSAKLQPNPVVVELTPAAPPPKPSKKVARRKTTAKPAAKKPKAKPAPKATSSSAAPPAQSQPAASPWPPAQQPR